MKQPRILLLLLLFAALVCSCKKEDDSDLEARKTMMTGKWKYTEFVWDDNHNQVPDDSVWLPSVNGVDFFYDLKNDGAAAVISDSAGVLTTEWGHWELTSSGTKLHMYSDTSSSETGIYFLSATDLTLMLDSSASMERCWFLFKKQ